ILNDYILNASNPGQFYYNVFYAAAAGSSFTLTVDIPWPFVTQGATPIQVHDAVGVNGGCFVPSPSLSGFTIQTAGGNLSSSGSPIILLSDYATKNISGSTTVTVSGTVPASKLLYVTIHLDYGLKKQDGWQQAPDTTTLQGPDTDLNCTTNVSGAGSTVP